MAVDFKTEHTRSSEYLFDPAQITIKPEFNGRATLHEVSELVASFLSLGQLQPVLIGNDGGKPYLITGHSRWRAALEINKKKLSEKPFKLRCVYFRGDERRSFLATIAENRERTATDELDDAHNIARLEQVFQMSLEEIAAEYRKDVKWVKDRLALIDLATESVEAFKNGKIKNTSAAVSLAKLSKDAQKQRIKQAGDGQITGAIIKGVTENGNGHVKSRRISELRSFWTPYAEQEKKSKLNRFASAHLSYLAGGDPDEYFRTVSELLG